MRSRLKVLGERFARIDMVRGGVRCLLKAVSLADKGWSFIRARALLEVPEGSVCHWSVVIKYPENVTFSGPVVIGPGCVLGAKSRISFGNRVRVSQGVLIETASLDVNAELPYPHISKPITIGDGVWLGANAIVLAGVRIGTGAVIGAGAVVSKDVPQGAIVVGAGTRRIERKEKYGQ